MGPKLCTAVRLEGRGRPSTSTTTTLIGGQMLLVSFIYGDNGGVFFLLCDVTITRTIKLITKKETEQLNNPLLESPDASAKMKPSRLNGRRSLQDARGAKWRRTGGRKEPTCFVNAGFHSYHSDFEVFKRETFPTVQPDGNNSWTYYEPLAAR